MRRSFLTLIVGACVLSSGRAEAQQFVVNAGAFPGAPVWSNGVAIADVDSDGDQDVLFANGSSYGSGGAQPQHLFLNNGTGSFTAAHANLNVANFNAQMVIAEDFDNDGDLDLMYAPEGPFPATTQRPRFLINDGSGTFSDQSNTRLPSVTMASFCVCAGDIDDDGDLDVVFTNGATFGGVASQALLFENDGAGFFTNATAARMPVDLYNAQDVVLFDWDGDADIDIALSGKGGTGKRSRLYVNDGTGHFTISPALDNLGTSNTYEIDWCDLDGDGDLDGLVNSLSGFNEGWARNNGPSVTTSQFPGINGNDDNEMAGLDYDDDGDIDVFVGSLTASAEKVYRNDGGVFVFASGLISSQTDSTLDLAFADLNGDGRYDIVTAQGESGNFTNKVYFNAGPADSRGPTLLNLSTPAAIGVNGTVLHILIRDAIADDGKVNATASVSYSINGGPTSVVSGFHMGGGLFRAHIPTDGFSTSVSGAWSASDSAGNVSMFAPFQVGASAVTFDGLKHTPLGTASLSAGPMLTVGNIGSSGMDGVAIALGGVDSHALVIESASPAVLPTGANLQVTALGDLNGVPNQVLAKLTMTDAGSVLAVTYDPSPMQPVALYVEAFLGGALVGGVTYTPPPAVSQVLASLVPAGCDIRAMKGYESGVFAEIGLLGPGPVDLMAGGGAVMADSLKISADVAPGPGCPCDGCIYETQIVGQNLGSIKLASERIDQYGHDHHVLGGATFGGDGSGNIVVDNLGSSGMDGVAVTLPDVTDGVTIALADVPLGPNEMLHLSSVGQFGGSTIALGDATIVGGASGHSVLVDFSSIGATMVLTQVWKGPNLVGSATVPGGGAVGTILPGTNGLASIGGCGKLPPDPPCLVINLNDDFPFLPANAAAPIVGDQIRVLAANASGQIDSLSEFQILLNSNSLGVECVSGFGFAPYGQGCPGTGGLIPALSMTGCPRAGESATLVIEDGMASSAALVFIGLQEVSVPVGGGCLLLVSPVLLNLVLPLSASGAIAVPLGLPQGVAGISVTMQAFVLDQASPIGAAGSNGLKITLE